MLNNFFFGSRAVYEIMWKKYGTDGQPIDDNMWCMRIACWTPKPTNTQSENVILITFELQQV